jgi:hypothetical protein
MTKKALALAAVVLCLVCSLCFCATAYGADKDAGPTTTTIPPQPTPVAKPQTVAVTTTIGAMDNGGKFIDGQRVVFSGEAIGDIVDADADHKWLTLLAGGSSISVYVTDNEAAQVTSLGRYAQKGTELQITGHFYLSDEKHDDTSDVRASKVVVLSNGGSESQHVNLTWLAYGATFILLGVGLSLLYRFLRERTR